jgi:hypothetical protein
MWRLGNGQGILLRTPKEHLMETPLSLSDSPKEYSMESSLPLSDFGTTMVSVSFSKSVLDMFSTGVFAVCLHIKEPSHHDILSNPSIIHFKSFTITILENRLSTN